MDFCITNEFIEYSYQSENILDVDDPDDGYNSFDEMFTGIDDSELNDDDKRFHIRDIKKKSLNIQQMPQWHTIAVPQ